MRWQGGWLLGDDAHPVVHKPGRNAGYRSGRCLMQGGCVHITAGNNSGGLIQSRGLAPILIPHDWPIEQYGEIDGVHATQCEWNVRIAGVETEKLRVEDLTLEPQIEMWAFVVSALQEFSIPPAGYYLGPRIPVGAPLPAPYISHSSLVHRACDQHYDFLSVEDMERIFTIARGGSTPTRKRGRRPMFIYAETASGPWKWMRGRRWLMAPNGRSTEIDAVQWQKWAGTGTVFEGDGAQCAQLLGFA